ncbi:MAG: DegT/DnrJ/EryC1/StrS family aminotransferase [Candidatus Paceibacterota bacterium]|jgi:dTDP-4-amino-4,6-dideoxygalactose transaminase
MKYKIPLFKIYWDKNDVKAVTQVIESGMNWAIGPKIAEFEDLLAGYVGVKYALSFSSGTSALHALMIACGIGPGDEVIVPSFTFIATANAVLFVGAKPVFAEIEPETFGLDPEDVERKITSKTKAIMPIHFGGCPCKIREIKKISEKHNLILLEDAAESLGSGIKKKVGSFGAAAMISFCQNKVITTGEGAVVTTNSREIYEKLKLIRSHGRVENENYFSSVKKMDHIALGYNFRMSNILAALGISQFKKVGKIIKIRQKNANYLNDKLADVKEIILPIPPKDYFHVFQMYTIRVKEGKKLRDGLKDYLNDRGIMTKIYFDLVHLTDFYEKNFGWRKGDLPATEKISEQVLTLPVYPTLTLKELDYITKEIKNFFKGYGK